MGRAQEILDDLRDRILKEDSEAKSAIDSVKSMNEEMEAVERSSGGAKRSRNLVRYVSTGNTRRPAGDVKTQEALEAGVYVVDSDISGIYFELHNLATDELLRFDDPRHDAVLNEIDEFWKLRERYHEMGYTHKRGILLHGAPGTGKSCLLQLVGETIVNNGDVVLLTRNVGLVTSALQQLREVEPERRILVVLEDVDQQVNRGMETDVLELMDGGNQVDGMLLLGTTNYLDRMPERMTRTGRFDRILEIKNPPKEGRYAYLQHKLGMFEDESKLDEIADKTDGFTFGELKEFLVSVYCFKNEEDKVIDRIKNHRKE